MLVQDFKQQLTWYTSEDSSYLQKAQHRLSGKSKKDREFVNTLPQISVVHAEHVNNILKEFIDNPLGEQLFGKKYNGPAITQCLKDREFVAFVVQSHLYTKLLMLEPTSEIEEILRIYAAILNFNEYKYAH